MRTTWAEIKAERMKSPEVRAAYERAGRMFELGERVRALRLAKGLTQRELAAAAGTSTAAIARLEGGGMDPRVELLARLSEALDARLEIRLEQVAL